MTVITGKVIHGHGYGKKLGFPTANIDRRQYRKKHADIRLGIYSGDVAIERTKKVYPAAIVIGPLDSKGLPKLEAHLLNFKGNLYGQKLELHLQKYLRPFKNYKSEEKLIETIRKDIAIVASIKY